MYHYIKNDDDTFSLIDNDTHKVLHTSEEVAVCYDKADKTLLKHGDFSTVTAYHEEAVRRYARHSFRDIAKDICVFSSRHWDVDELNKCLDICDYVARAVQKMTGEYQKPTIQCCVPGLNLSDCDPDILKLKMCPACKKTDTVNQNGMMPILYCCECAIEWFSNVVRPYEPLK